MVIVELVGGGTGHDAVRHMRGIADERSDWQQGLQMEQIRSSPDIPLVSHATRSTVVACGSVRLVDVVKLVQPIQL